MSFLELILVASIKSDSGIKPHQPRPFRTFLTSTVHETLAQIPAKSPDDSSSHTTHSPSHWHTLSAVMELATEHTELVTGINVPFQPDQLAKQSEIWLHEAGLHLIDSAKHNPDPAANALLDATTPSQAQPPNDSLSIDQSTTGAAANGEELASSASAPDAKPMGLIERFRPRTAQPQTIVQVSRSSTATASIPSSNSQSQLQHTSCAHRSTLPKDSPLFQVWVGKQVVFNLLNSEQAEAAAQKLRTVLAQDAPLEPERFQLRLFENQPAIYVEGALDGQPLLVVTDELAQAFNNDSTLLAIDWVNHLRTAFNGAPLDVAHVQAEMYDLKETAQQIEGHASWYGPWFHGRLTATGEIFDKGDLTAAHPSLPFDTYLKVTNLENNRSLIVRINDRGPYIEGRNLDLSHRAAQCLGSEETGVVPFRAVVMDAPVDMAAVE